MTNVKLPKQSLTLSRDDPEALVLLRGVTTNPHGGDRKSENIKIDNIQLDNAPTGTSKAYSLDKLKVAGYARVSRPDQDISIQVRSITDYCQRNGYQLYNLYQDAGVSGAKDSRPEFDEMLNDMRHYKFNSIMVTKLDRIGRSLKHIVSLFEEFNKLGVHFIATTQNIDTSSAAGRLQMQLMAAFAEFERNIISERTKDGIAGKLNVGKRGPDKKPRKKRGVSRKPVFEIGKVGA